MNVTGWTRIDCAMTKNMVSTAKKDHEKTNAPEVLLVNVT